MVSCMACNRSTNPQNKIWWLWLLLGGAEGDRTPDLLNAIQALSQLSYGPVFLQRISRCV
jgi:hypothetical protein